MRALAFAALAAVSAQVAAETVTARDIEIGDPVAFATPPTARAAGGYMTITNRGAMPDRLLEVRADFPRVALHRSEAVDGIVQMRPVEAVDIGAGETVTLAPGGLHVMFMGLGGDPFEAGEEVPATLVFERAGEVGIRFSVKARTETGLSTQGEPSGGNGD